MKKKDKKVKISQLTFEQAKELGIDYFKESLETNKKWTRNMLKVV